ncbi:MAG: MFS transporter [Opitutales bacterium]|nr:MFS transporter [Opitutales bacterium]
MEKTKSFKKCIWLLGSHALVTFNDNLAKYMLLGLCGVLMSQAQFEQANVKIGLLLVLPFILFAPLAGWLADRYSKKTVISATLAAQIGGLGIIAIGMSKASLSIALVGFFLLAVQTIFFSPARYGILKELVGSRQLGLAIGWTEMLGMSAVLTGGFAGGIAYKIAYEAKEDKWQAGLVVTGGIMVLSLLSWVLFQPTKKTPSKSSSPFRIRNVFGHFQELTEAMRDRGLRLSLLGFAWFLGVAWMVILCLSVVAKEIAPPEEVGQLTGIFNLFLGVGIILGSVFTAYINRGRVELGTVSAGAIGMALALLLTGLFAPQSPESSQFAFNACLILMGFSGAIFSVPLRGFMVDRAGEERRGRVLASSTLLSNLFGLSFIGLHSLLLKAGLSANEQLLFMALPSLIVTGYVLYLLPEALFRTLVLLMTRIFYRLRIENADKIPSTGGALLIANHISYADPAMIGAACPRPVRFIGFSGLAESRFIRFIFKLSGVIPVSPTNAREAITKAAEHIADGEIVCIFPEGCISRTGAMHGLKRGFELIAKRANAPVIPVSLDGLWGSIFSYERSKFFKKKPIRIPYPLTVNFGTPMSAKEASSATARQAMQDLAEEAFSQRPVLRSHIGLAAFKGLAAAGSREILIDRTQDRKPMKAKLLLALGLAFRDRLAKATSAKRVGIVLPPGIGATVANLACVLGGKVPVNLNFSLGAAALESCVKRADIDTLITTEKVKKRCPNLPKTPTELDIKDELEELKKTQKFGIGLRLGMITLLPAGLAAAFFKVPRHGDREEAALIFTSGSSGEPKGVVLSHRNLLGNVTQISDINLISPDQILLGNLPLFHSFGFLVTLWYPLIKGIRLVTLPSPLELRKSIDAIYEEKVTALLGTPTFLKPYLRKADSEKMASLQFVIAGAEKTPKGLAEEWESKFGSKYLEGYGLTETSPVSSVNLPDPPDIQNHDPHEKGSLNGAAGRLLPGVTIRFVDPDTDEEKAYGESGIIKLRGPNIFEGYLGQTEKTDEVLKDGWFTTGDLGRLDEDGFLHIEGRLSRFSKIGGEMVPHGTVEEAIVNALEIDPGEGPVIAIASREDSAKGEALVLLSSVKIDFADLRSKLSASGLANLWIPKVHKIVESIPTLATGKLDLKGIQKIAQDA